MDELLLPFGIVIIKTGFRRWVLKGVVRLEMREVREGVPLRTDHFIYLAV